ncbi:MAG: exosome complex protein Rrp42 [DPANN group archaeon]|nr:exosome complex protein Rrp42 [DPANN group archaeon]
MQNEMQKNMLKYLEAGLRRDGRKKDEWRRISVEKGVSANAEGSARVKIGETEVLVGVKMIVDKPYPDRPDEGTLMVGAELLPMSSPDFETGPPGIWAIEIARVVDRGIRESGALDNKALCIKAGEHVWIISIDIVTINDAGNLLDASALGTLAAIEDTRFPAFDGEAIDYKTKTDKRIKMNKHPISVTVWKIGKHLLVDPTSDEEEAAEARLTVASIEDGKLCAMQKGGEEPLDMKDIQKMVDMALENAAKIRKNL